MSYFCEDCGEYLGGYGHLYSPCSQKLVSKRLATQLKQEYPLPWSLGIIRQALNEAHDRRVREQGRADWIDDAAEIKAAALVALCWDKIKGLFATTKSL